MCSPSFVLISTGAFVKKPSATETRTIECAEIFTIVIGRLPQCAIASAALNEIVPNMFLLIRASV